MTSVTTCIYFTYNTRLYTRARQRKRERDTIKEENGRAVIDNGEWQAVTVEWDERAVIDEAKEINIAG